MELLIIVVVLVALAFLIGAPLAAISKASNAQEENDLLKDRVSDLETQLNQLRAKVDSAFSGNASTSQKTETAPPASSNVAAKTVLAAPPILPKMDERPIPSTVGEPPVLAAMPEALVASSLPKATPPPPLNTLIPPIPPPVPMTNPIKHLKINWEQFVGVKLVAFIGGFVAFLFVVFGLKDLIDRGLIVPWVRAVMGYVFGGGLLCGGLYLSRRRYGVLSQTLCATAVVILYAVTYVCHAVYRFEIFGTIPTFLVMVMITTGAFILAVRLNAMVVAILGMLGGFLTPILVSTGQDNPLALFGYIAVLDLGLVAVVLNRRWNFLVLLAALGTAFLQIEWANVFFVPGKIFTAQAIFLGFCALFLLATCLAKARKQDDNWFVFSSVTASVMAFGFVFYLVSLEEFSTSPGMVFTLAFGADVCVLILVAIREMLLPVQLFSGMAVFLALNLWMAKWLKEPLLYWALGLSLLFALVHTVFPLVLGRLKPGCKPCWWANLFPVLALILMLTPVGMIPDISLAVWPCILVVDAFAILMAIVTGTFFAIVGTILLTLGITGVWIDRIPTVTPDVTTILLIIGAEAAFFFGVGIYAVEKILSKKVSEAGVDSHNGFREISPEMVREIPASGALWPFLLLVMVVLKLHLHTPSAVFGLAAVLSAMVLGLSVKLRTQWMPLICMSGVLLLEHVWHVRLPRIEAPALSLGWYCFFYLLFTAYPIVFWKRFEKRPVVWAVAGLAGPLHFYLIHNLIHDYYPNDFMGLVPGAFAICSLAALAFVLKQIPMSERGKTPVAWTGGTALFFITLIFPVQFDREWITLGWALEGTALVWLYHRVQHGGLRWTGVGLLLAAFARLALNPAVLDYHARTGTPIFNWYLYAYLVTAACLFVGAWLMAPPRNKIGEFNVPPLLNTLGVVLLFLLVNIEIADYFSTGETLTFEFSGNLARDMTYTIAWSTFAFAMLVYGVWKAARFVRYVCWGLLCIVVVKLFFHDLANLGQLYRLGALISVAVILFLASFTFQRFLNRRTRDNGNPPASKS